MQFKSKYRPQHRGMYKRGIETRRKVYYSIIAFTENNGYPPSIRDIASDCGLQSTSSVLSILRKLRDRGLVEYQDGKMRTVRVTDEPLPDIF